MKRLVVLGVGPGDPELLTIKAVKLLKEADVLFYPVKGEGERSIAYETVKNFAVKAERVPLLFPMTKDADVLGKAWRKAAEAVLSCPFSLGVFAVLGDPSLYSTYFYIHEFIKDRIEIEFVPGVTSISACCASLGMSLVQGGESLLVISASHSLPSDIDKNIATVVLMKVPKDKKQLEDFVSFLKGEGFSHFFHASRCQTEKELIQEGIPKEVDYLSMIIAKRN